MKTRGLSEEDAYALLRTTAMKESRSVSRGRPGPGHRRRAAGTGGGRNGMSARTRSRRLHAPRGLRRGGRREGRGLRRREGIDLTLVRESPGPTSATASASAISMLAHMLGPMPIASNLGLTPPLLTIVPFSLGLGGNASPSRAPSGPAWRRTARTPISIRRTPGPPSRRCFATGAPRARATALRRRASVFRAQL